MTRDWQSVPRQGLELATGVRSAVPCGSSGARPSTNPTQGNWRPSIGGVPSRRRLEHWIPPHRGQTQQCSTWNTLQLPRPTLADSVAPPKPTAAHSRRARLPGTPMTRDWQGVREKGSNSSPVVWSTARCGSKRRPPHYNPTRGNWCPVTPMTSDWRNDPRQRINPVPGRPPAVRRGSNGARPTITPRRAIGSLPHE
jgi:hypothetical protein